MPLKGISSSSIKSPGKPNFSNIQSSITNKIKKAGIPNLKKKLNNIEDDLESSENSDVSAISGDHNDESVDQIPHLTTEDGRPAVCLEATMYLKFSKSTGKKTRWFEAYVVLDMDNRGSVKCYPRKPKLTGPAALDAYKKHSTRVLATLLSFEDNVEPLLEIPARINWVAKDLENSSTRFVIEIPTEGAIVRQSLLSTTNTTTTTTSDAEGTAAMSAMTALDSASTVDDPNADPEELDDSLPPDDNDDEEEEEDLTHDAPASLMESIQSSRRKGEPFSLHVQCMRRGGSEKQVWMKAFEELGRKSFDRHKRVFGITRKWKDPKMKLKHERIRTVRDDLSAKQSAILSSQSDDVDEEEEDDESIQELRLFGPKKSDFRLTQKSDTKEFLVYPSYAYPNKWMTHSELFSEMLKPSEVFHDTRLSSEARKEIGTARVEVLECSGLPNLDRNAETDAVVYLVCGSYAFTTDVILNKLNPVWLPRARRACIFPIFHAYAKIYAGVFDDDGKGQNDDFAGRVVLDLAKCRPGTTYDVALPLRLSSHVYSRRPRGVIRLRFSIDYPSVRSALLSYLPAKRKGQSATNVGDDVTVLCNDEKAFRNTTLTVHGVDFPGRFSSPLMKATVREFDFVRKVSTNIIENHIFDVIFWKNRSVSGFCFFAWMHCVYVNSMAMVPFYMIVFMLLIMMQNYVFYGSDGRIQHGFIPPSFEEMFAGLFQLPGRKSRTIEPLYVKPHRDDRSALVPGKTYKTHVQKGKIAFQLLGFSAKTEDDQPEDYQMEFPLSRGLRHPLTDEYQYPRFTVEESRVSKTAANEKSKDDVDSSYAEIFSLRSGSTAEDDPTTPSPPPTRLGMTTDALQSLLADHNPANEIKSRLKTALKKKSTQMSDIELEMEESFRNLPPIMRIPHQDIDAKQISGEKKKVLEELNEARANVHKLTKHLFHDKTHIIGQEDAVYFGGKKSKNVVGDLDKLLGAGQYAVSNPVMSKIGLHLEPLIDAAHAVLGAFRSITNIVTWQDPILSFWATLVLIAAAIVSIIFPFRLFFFVIGVAVLGPQNFFFIRFIRPNFLEELKEKKEVKRQARLAKKTEAHFKGVPTNQPIFTAHTSDNSPPLSLSLEDVDERAIHQICVPYSQLTYRRDSYWPPQPEYGKCEPNSEVRE
eukprot:scaffold2557_cov121-Cylindrotheca_fusiformis.AAC.1